MEYTYEFIGTPEFEEWWQNTYKDKLGSYMIEQSFKEIAYITYTKFIGKVERDRDDARELAEELKVKLSDYDPYQAAQYKFGWEKY